MAAGSALHMVIVGADDVPLYEADLSAKSTDAGAREVRLVECGLGRQRCWGLFA